MRLINTVLVAAYLVLGCFLPSHAAVTCPSNAAPSNGAVLNGTSGVISLWPYTINNFCQWTVQCPPSTVFRVQNLTMYTEQSYDYLSISMCGSGTRRYSGALSSLSIATNSSSVAVSFFSDSSIVYQGFVLTYECVPLLACSPSVGLFSDAVNCSQPLSCPALAVSHATYFLVSGVEVCDPTSEASSASSSGSESGGITVPTAYVQLAGQSTGNSIAAQVRLLPSAPDTIYFSAPPSSNATFLLDYQCGIGALCDSVNTSVAVTGAEGVIISDTDGVGRNPISPFDSCMWMVTCPYPNNTIFAGVSINAALGTHLSFYSASSGLQLALIDGYQETKVLLINASSVWLTFASSSPSSQRGFTLQYSCRNGLCSSVNASGVTFSGLSSGTILSDVDGIGPVPYAELEQCEWTVDCGAGSAFFISNLQVALREARDWLNVSDATTNLQLAAFTSGTTATSPTSFLFGSPSVVVRFSSAHTLSTPRAGFTLQFQCVPRTCATLQGSQPMQNCSLTLPAPACPAGVQGGSFVGQALDWPGLTSSVSTGVSLDIVLDGVDSIHYTPAGSVITQNAVQSNSAVVANVVLPVGGGVGLLFGFTSCGAPCHSSNASGSLYTQQVGEVLTTPGVLPAGQLCSWMLWCPMNRYLEFLISVDQADFENDIFVINQINGLRSWNYVQFPYYGWRFSAARSGATVTWVQGTNSFAEAYVDVSWRCAHPRCSSVNETGSVFTNATGRLVSGSNGYPNEIYRLDNCSWVVQCPAQTYFSISNLNIGANYYFPAESINVTDLATGVRLLTIGGGVFNQGFVTTANAVRIEFANNYSYIYGFTLDWACLPSSCDSSACTAVTTCSTSGVLCPVSGALLGAAAWIANAADVIVTAVQPGRSSQFTDDGQLTVFDYELTTLPNTLTSNSSALVAFPLVATAEGSDGTVGYKCLPSGQCSSANVSGSVYSDMYGALVMSGSGQQSCEWFVTCPRGYTVFIPAWEKWDDYECTLTVSSADGTLFNEYGDGSGALLTGYQHVFVGYTCSSYASSSTATVEWQCVVGSCTSPDATGTVFTAAEDTIAADYVPTDQCSWTVNCGSGATFTANISGRLTGGQLTLSNAAGDAQWGTTLSGSALRYNQPYTLPTSAVSISLTANPSGEMGWFQMHYRCVSTSMPTPTPTGTGTKPLETASLSTPILATALAVVLLINGVMCIRRRREVRRQTQARVTDYTPVTSLNRVAEEMGESAVRAQPRTENDPLMKQ